jgi:TPR repeat protein
MKGLSPRLQAIRTRMLAHRSVPYKDLQRLADAGDGLAALFLARRIQSMDAPALVPDAIHYYASAAYAGRTAAVKPLIELLSAATGLSASTLDQARTGLEAQADHRHPDAIVALARFYGPQPIFGNEPGLARAYLMRSANSGSSRAALDLAILLIGDGSPSGADRSEAIKYLGIARQVGDVGAIAIADSLLRLLDPPQPAPAAIALEVSR